MAPHSAAASEHDSFPLYCLLTLVYGLVNGLTSPALPEWARQGDLTPGEVGSLFLFRGCGSMIGAFLIGAVLDVARDPHAVLAACLVLRIAAGVCMPYAANTLVGVGADLWLVAFCGNGIYVCVSTSISWSYGKLMGARVSLMDSMFGIGGSLSPVLASFLIANQERAVNGYQVVAGLDVLFVVLSCAWKARPNPKFDAAEPAPVEKDDTDPLKARLLEDDGCAVADPTTSPRWLLVIVCALMVVCYDISMSCVMFWFFYWSTQQMSIGGASADALNTLFWIFFMGVQFVWAYLQSGLGVPALRILKYLLPFQVVVACGIALPGPVGAASMVCLGLAGGMNALVTTVLRQSSQVGGKVMGVLRIASACGNMCGGASVGFLLNSCGNSALPIVAVGGAFLNLSLFLVLLRVIANGKG